MIPAVAMRRQPTRHISWLFRVLLIAPVPLVIRFGGHTLRYWSFDPRVFGDLWPRRYGMLMHLTGGSVAILIGPVQLWLGESRRALSWRQVLGKVYLAGVTAGCLGAFYLSLTTNFVGWVYASGLFGLASAWSLTTVFDAVSAGPDRNLRSLTSRMPAPMSARIS